MHKHETSTDILILGAGIGGYEVFRSLHKHLRRAGLTQKITIVDRNPFFTFVPMMHEVVSGSIEPSHATLPLRDIVAGTPHEFVLAEVTHVDPGARIVKTDSGTIHYTYLVVALGSATHFFNVPGAEEYSCEVRTFRKALSLRSHLLSILEAAKDEARVTIVGGGYSGAEVAGQLAEFNSSYVSKYFPGKKLSITIVESAPTILAQMSPRIQSRVLEKLRAMGISILTGKRVTEVCKDAVVLDQDEKIHSDCTIWTAGVRNIAENFFDKNRTIKGRLPVNEYLQHPDFKDVFAIGDIALFIDKGSDTPAPQLGETAHKEGLYLARAIVRRLQNKPVKPFSFESRGTLMPIGDWWGVAALPHITFFGRLAWFIRRTVYLMYMPGIAQKVRIALDWTLHLFGREYIIDDNEKRNKK